MPMRHFTAIMAFIITVCLTAEARVCPMEECLPQSSILNLQSSILNLQSSILNSQSSIFNSQSSIFNSQSSIFNFQSSIIKGDANGDGDVNISDAVLLVNNLLGTTAIGFIAENCDMNSDGDLNVSDVALIIKLIMEGDNTMGPGDAEDPDVNGN